MHDPGDLVLARTDLLDSAYHSYSLLCLILLSGVVVLVVRAAALVMGNEGSLHSSECSTPLSEYASMYSYSLGSRPRSSVPSTRAPSPVQAPEPDLSHLSPDEVAQIKAVMDRAKNMQEEEQMRVRGLEEEYINYATRIEREASLSEISDSGCSLCPICNKTEIRLNEDGSKEGPNVCADCEKVTCPECGQINTNITTKAPEWVCMVCEKRRRLIMSTGLWYHGYHPDADLPLERELNGDEPKPGELQEFEVPEEEGAVALPVELTEGQGQSQVQGASSGLLDSTKSLDQSQNSRMSSSRMESSADSLKDSSVSSFEIVPAKPSRFKGTGGLTTESDSEEYSDYEMEDISGKPRSEGTNTDDAADDFSSMSTSMSTVSNGDRGPKPRRKHRPKSLNLSRSHSLTSSDEETEDQSELGTNQDSEDVGSMRSDDTDAAFDLGIQIIPEVPARVIQPPPPLQALAVGDGHEKGLSSPTPPRSPSWREGLESPPFSPKRRDSYPGKKRSVGSPVSPKDKRHHFTYNDMSPPSRQLSLDELYSEGPGSDPTQHSILMPQKPSPISPEEIKNSLVTTLGEPLKFDMAPPTREKKNPAPAAPAIPQFERDLSDSAPVMDLATYAATIASSTASLTSMSVSPTNLRVNSSYDTEVSPESMDSTESPSSPVSPGYYDNATPPDEEVELADPSTKSIDYQGSKRQKARPPTTDWSPVIDLSPILDVSPSVEEAEQEDMLAKQLEELERQRSREEEQEEMDEEAEDLLCSEGAAAVVRPMDVEEEDEYTYTGLKRYNIMEDISRIENGNQRGNPHGNPLGNPHGNPHGGNPHGNPHVTTQSDDENGNGNYDGASGQNDDFPLLACTSLAQPVPASRSKSRYSKAGGDSQPRTVSSSRPHVENSTTSEIRKISEDLQNMLKNGAANIKPIPPPKPRRKLPDPTTEAEVTQKSPLAKPVPQQKPPVPQQSSIEKGAAGTHETVRSVPTGKFLPRQDSAEKRKAKELKAKPNPILIQHIEAEEQSVSPHYKVLDSPPTPEQKTSIKREFSESTSVSPSSSPDHELYTFPSPVTPPDSDSSPPKPHSPSSTGTDLDEELSGQKPIRTISYGSNLSDLCNHNVPDTVEVPELPQGAPPPIPPQAIFALESDPSPRSSPPPVVKAPAANPRTQINPAPRAIATHNPEPLAAPVQNSPPPPSAAVTLSNPISNPLYNPPPQSNAPSQSNPQPQTNPRSNPLSHSNPQPQSSPRSNPPPQENPAPRSNPPPQANPPPLSNPHPTPPAANPATPSQESDPDVRAAESDAAEEPRQSIRDKLKYFEEVKSDVTPRHSSHVIAARPKDPPKIEPKPKEVKKEIKDPKKVRRKLPPIPTNEEPVLTPKAKLKGAKPVAPKPRPELQKPQKAPKPGQEQRKYSSQSDDSMNEEDLEVARINRMPEKKVLGSVGKAKSLEISEAMLQEKKESLVSSQIRLQRASSLGTAILPKDETDAIIDSLINIYGIPCTEAMKSLKKRLQEELRRVTLDRKRKLEELEEIRALQMQIGALKLETELIQRQAFLARNGKMSPATMPSVETQQDTRKRGLSPSSSTLTPRSSPQVTPRRQRHKRQSSDPMIAKFSPIKEDRDIEADFQAKMSDGSDARHSKYSTDDSSLSGLSDTESTRSEPVSSARYKKIKPSAYARMFYTGKAGSSERLPPDQSQFNGQMPPMSVSRSETQLPGSTRSGSRSGSRTPNYYSDEEEERMKEDKKARLQYEIDKRKKQLEETARLKTELLKLARARQSMAHSYDDLPGRYTGPSPYGPQRPIPTGIIRPLDDETRYDRDDVDAYSDGRRSGYHSNYSSTEYLAHKHETSRRHRSDDTGIYQNYSEYADPATFSPPNTLPRRMDSYPSVVNRDPNAQAASSRDARLSSSVTLPDMYSNRGDLDFVPSRESTVSYSTYSDADSPQSDYTPAMPLLDDVTAKSRKIIHDIGTGSRPVSAEFNFGGVEDLMNAVYRTESDNSVDADEPIMKHMTEGGVTILKQLDRRRKPLPPEPIKYNFPTKRILVTRDPKDRCVTGRKGNGIGMKIVGGKQIPGSNQIGAFVTTIYPGGIAEQLHGELQIGDQVLEWNGISLTGRTYEEVQQIITQPNGEIEMTVRPLTKHRGKRAIPDHCTEQASCHSSYDNLDAPSEEEHDSRYASRHGVDPRQLAAQLEEIQETGGSPENSPSSSSHQDFLTPSMCSPCSTPHSDPTSSLPDTSRHQRSHVVSSDLASSRDRNKVGDVGEGGSPRHHHHGNNGRSERRRRGRDPESASSSSTTDRRRADPVGESDQSPASSERQRLDRRREHGASSRSRGQRSSPKEAPVPVPRERHRERNRDGAERSPSSDRLKVSRGSEPNSRGSDPNLNRSNGQQHLSDESSRSSTPSSRRRSREHESGNEKSTRSNTLRTDSADSDRRSSNEMLKAEPSSAPPSRSPSKRRLADKGNNSVTQDKRQSSLPETSAPVASLPSSSSSSERHRSHSQPENAVHAVKSKKQHLTHKEEKKEKAIAAAKEKDKQPPGADDNGAGEIQLQVSQDDFDNTLNVHVIQARNLRPRDINGLSDPFVKVYLLPGRGPENKRRTRHISRTLNPEWHQTLIFQNVARGELLNKVLEITLWDYDRFKTNDFLGELILELSEMAFLDNKPHWYPLRDHVPCASFELPKSSVPPPFNTKVKDTPAHETREPPSAADHPRPGRRTNGRAKKHGSGESHSSQESESQMGPRRRSLGTLADDPQEPQAGAPTPRHNRRAVSATSSPVPKRRPRDSKSPNNRSNGAQHRCHDQNSPVYVDIQSVPPQGD